MGSKTSLFGKLKAALRAFFKDDLVLRRDGAGLHVALADRTHAAPPRPPSRAERQARKEEGELTRARAALAALLDEDATLRSSLRHLAFIEHALERKGWRGLYKVPLDVLQHALAQLESLVTNWSSEGLACLRSKMAVAILDREHQDVNAEAEQYKTAAVLDGAPAVAEATEVVPGEDEGAALLATYAALGLAPPVEQVELQGELGSPSAQALTRQLARQS